MVSQVLDQFEFESPNDFLLRDIPSGPAWAPYGTEAPALVGETEFLPTSSAADGKCVKGALVALALEAGAAICAFSIWQLWHLYR
jgi:hypothetical protein